MTSATPATAHVATPGVSFIEESNPRVSIVVLAWKLTDQLLSCLHSLRASLGAPSFEVQLVLNGAAPEVRATVESLVRGANIIDLDVNAGFGGGCNAGAATARGEFLIFLNDDTIVSPTWMATLVSVGVDHPTAAAVASVLLNSNGTVQEAGSRVLSTAGTVQFGKGMTQAAAEAAGLFDDREIDYGSGAALLVRRRAFDEVWGFDPLFEPAYFEDVDLCFRLRQSGHAVLLAGAARVMHLSGESTKGNHRFREFASWRSGIRFVARWSATLAKAPSAEAPPTELCDPGRWTEPIANEQRTRVAPETSALSTSVDFAQWLNARLDQVEHDRDAAQHSLSAANAEVELAGAHVRDVNARLADLDSRGPIGILKWKVGVAANRRKERGASQ